MVAVLDVETVSKTFPGQIALDQASLVVQPGRVHALIGQNGSGKSTLIKILAGYHRADDGAKASFFGRDLDLVGGAGGGIERLHVMHQDLGLVSSLNTVENLALGRGFHTGFLGRVRWRDETAGEWRTSRPSAPTSTRASPSGCSSPRSARSSRSLGPSRGGTTTEVVCSSWTSPPRRWRARRHPAVRSRTAHP